MFRSALIALAVLSLAACGKSDDAAKKEAMKKGAMGPVPVTVVKAEARRVPVVLEAVGQAEGSRDVEIRARVSGILEKRLYSEGAPVKAGSVLFVVDPQPYEIAVAQARASVAQEQARREQTQREADRLKGLVEQKAISQREYDDAVSAAKQSQATLQGAQARLQDAQLHLNYTRVTAPISGIAGRATRSEGSLVTANTESSLLTTVTQVNPIWVRFSLAESDYSRIRGTQNARVKLLNDEGKVVAENGRLNFAGSSVDARLGTVQLRAEFPNGNMQWLPGQFVKVQILAGEQEAVLVPQPAVVQNEQERFVWLAGPDGKAVMRPVKTAGWLANDWIVTSGLNAGDPVIVDNLMKIRPGAPVQLTTQPASSSPR